MKHYVLALVMLSSGCSYLAPLVSMLPADPLSVEMQVGKENTNIHAISSEQTELGTEVAGDGNTITDVAASSIAIVHKVTAKKARSTTVDTSAGVATGEQSQAITVGDNSKVVINQGLDTKVLGGILGGIIFIPMLAYAWRRRR